MKRVSFLSVVILLITWRFVVRNVIVNICRISRPFDSSSSTLVTSISLFFEFWWKLVCWQLKSFDRDLLRYVLNNSRVSWWRNDLIHHTVFAIWNLELIRCSLNSFFQLGRVDVGILVLRVYLISRLKNEWISFLFLF